MQEGSFGQELTDDQQHVMAASLDGILREWSLTNVLKTEHPCTDVVALNGVTLSPDSRWLLLKEKGRPVLCDLREGITPVPLGDTLDLCTPYLAERNFVATLASKDGDINLWDLPKD